jgi:GGDEF domain-containing protein
MNKQESTIAGVVVGTIGIGVSVAVGVAVVSWLGVVAGIAALLGAYLTHLIVSRMTRAEEATARLSTQLGELEEAIASQIQARIQAEETARAANLRAADAELETSLTRRSDSGVPSPLTDEVTGLYGEGYFLATVEQRIAAARRHLRPVAVGLVEVIVDPTSQSLSPVDPNIVSVALAETLRDADTACRLDDGRFAIILEDTPENGAIWTVERIRRQISDSVTSSTLWAGLACYPAHGFDSNEILAQAEQALTAARDWPQDRIEVAEAR